MPRNGLEYEPWPPTKEGKADAKLVADVADGRFVTTVTHPDGRELGYVVTLPTGVTIDSEGRVFWD